MEHTQLIVAPSVLSADFSHMAEEVQTINLSAAKWIHFDIMDGLFVPNITFGPKFIQDLRPCSTLVFDTHLMIDSPERFVEQFARSGCNYITVHAESTVHLHRVLQMIHGCGCKAGVAIVPSTPVCMIEPILDIVDEVLVMTVNPGFGGQQLIGSTLLKISQLAQIRDDEGYSYLINTDGGINTKTISDIARSGADIAVCGSAFFNSDDRSAFVDDMIRLADVEYAK
ncbi:MAG: ribulose-phosphate 3-epimerase [Sphaerochaetaceae bacterium]